MMKYNSMYTLIDSDLDLLVYNNMVLIYPDPLGVSVNDECQLSTTDIAGTNVYESI